MSRIRDAAFGLGKFTLLFTAAIYILSLPFYYVIIAQPHGMVDALLPYEVVLCLGLSVGLFAWSGKTAIQTMKL